MTKTRTVQAVKREGGVDFAKLSRDEMIERLDDARDVFVAAVNEARQTLAKAWEEGREVLSGSDAWLAARGIVGDDGSEYVCDWPVDETCIPNVPNFVDQFEMASEPKSECERCGKAIFLEGRRFCDNGECEFDGKGKPAVGWEEG